MVFNNKCFDPDPRYLVSVALLQGSISDALKTKLRRRIREFAGFDFLADRARIKDEIRKKSSNGKLLVHQWNEFEHFQTNPTVREIPATLTAYLVYVRAAKGKHVVINTPAPIIGSTCRICRTQEIA